MGAPNNNYPEPAAQPETGDFVMSTEQVPAEVPVLDYTGQYYSTSVNHEEYYFRILEQMHEQGLIRVDLVNINAEEKSYGVAVNALVMTVPDMDSITQELYEEKRKLALAELASRV